CRPAYVLPFSAAVCVRGYSGCRHGYGCPHELDGAPRSLLAGPAHGLRLGCGAGGDADPGPDRALATQRPGSMGMSFQTPETPETSETPETGVEGASPS